MDGAETSVACAEENKLKSIAPEMKTVLMEKSKQTNGSLLRRLIMMPPKNFLYGNPAKPMLNKKMQKPYKTRSCPLRQMPKLYSLFILCSVSCDTLDMHARKFGIFFHWTVINAL
jgi:hypothetical protein